MKKIFFLLLLCSFAAVNAQKNKIIKTNPLGFILNIYNVGYEQEVTPNQSFTLNALYSNFSVGDLNTKGPGLSAGYRFYIQDIGLFGTSVSGDPFEGFFVGPTISISSLEFDFLNSSSSKSTLNLNGLEIDTTNSDGNIDTFNMSMAAIVGYQWNWNPITMELFVGAGLTKVSYDDNTSFSGSETGIGLTNLGFSVGYSF